MGKTLYTIFKEYEDGNWVEFMLDVQATSSKAAIRAALGNGKAANGRYTAVPSRSWKPQQVEIETKQQLKIG